MSVLTRLQSLIDSYEYITISVNKSVKYDKGKGKIVYIVRIKVPFISVSELSEVMTGISRVAFELGGSIKEFDYTSSENMLGVVIRVEEQGE